MEKKKNAFVRFFCFIGRGIRNFFFGIIFCLVFIFAFPFFVCRVKGKKKFQEDDEARVFLCNHYELFGPISMYMSFPLKFRPWIIDKMMEEECVEKQISLMIMNNYKRVPVWLKKAIIKSVKHFVVFVMHVARGISVSRENPRANIKTFSESLKTFEKHECILIFPEKLYVKEGVGEFQTGFEHLAKYYYKKTGKCITFYPTFSSQSLRTIYIGNPIKYSPKTENDKKIDYVKEIHDRMKALYEQNELGNKRLVKKREKKAKREEKNRQRKLKNKKKPKIK